VIFWLYGKRAHSINPPLGSALHVRISMLEWWMWTFSISAKKAATMSISWSKKFLLQFSFHSHLSSTRSPIKLIVEFCCLLIWYRVEYLSWRVKSSPIHLSFQNLILTPQPTFHLKFLVMLLLSCCWNALFRSFHQWEWSLLFLPESKAFQPPYLDNKILAQSWFWLFANSQPHLPSKAGYAQKYVCIWKLSFVEVWLKLFLQT